MVEYSVNIKDIWKLYHDQQYASALAKAQELVKIALESFLGSVYGFLDATSKIPSFRKIPLKFSDTIKESFSLGLISKEERKELDHLRRVRNEAVHDVFFDEKLRVGKERDPKEAFTAIEIAERFFALISSRRDNFTCNYFAWDEKLREEGVTDINKIFSTHTLELLQKCVWETCPHGSNEK